MTASFTFVLPLPLRGLGPNAREHWSTEARLTRAYAAECSAAIMASERPAVPLTDAVLTTTARIWRGRPRRNPDGSWPPWYRDHQLRQRPTDQDNLAGCLKAAVDSLVRCGVVADDQFAVLDQRAPRIERATHYEDECVVMTVVEVDA